MPQNDKALLLRLKDHDVQFVIIGGVSCVLHGTSLVTFDLDICCPPTVESWKRVEAAVKDLHPFHRLAANKLSLKLTDELASRLKNLYLHTDFGILDCIGEVAGVGDYEQVLKHSMLHTASYGAFRILQIDALIASKEAVGRERDLAAVKQLKAIKERTAVMAQNRQ